MLWAAVPEASVDKYGNAPLGERDVWTHELAVDSDSQVFAKPVAHSVQPGTEHGLGLCVASPDGGHVAGTARRCDVGLDLGRLRRVDVLRVPHADTVRLEGFDDPCEPAVVSCIERMFE